METAQTRMADELQTLELAAQNPGRDNEYAAIAVLADCGETEFTKDKGTRYQQCKVVQAGRQFNLKVWQGNQIPLEQQNIGQTLRFVNVTGWRSQRSDRVFLSGFWDSSYVSKLPRQDIRSEPQEAHSGHQEAAGATNGKERVSQDVWEAKDLRNAHDRSLYHALNFVRHAESQRMVRMNALNRGVDIVVAETKPGDRVDLPRIKRLAEGYVEFIDNGKLWDINAVMALSAELTEFIYEGLDQVKVRAEQARAELADEFDRRVGPGENHKPWLNELATMLTNRAVEATILSGRRPLAPAEKKALCEQCLEAAGKYPDCAEDVIKLADKIQVGKVFLR